LIHKWSPEDRWNKGVRCNEEKKGKEAYALSGGHTWQNNVRNGDKKREASDTMQHGGGKKRWKGRKRGGSEKRS